MAATVPALPVDIRFDPETGTAVPVGLGVVRVTAPNASAYTFTGTNSYLVGTEELFLIDPGPDLPAHATALERAIAGRPVVAILLTHTHRDHSALARRLAGRLDVPVWSGGRHRPSRPRRPFELDWVGWRSDRRLVPDRVLRDGETVQAGEVGLEVVATPGHCANHLAFGVVGTEMLFSGDHVMGWNSTLVPVPDGSMAAYLASLERLLPLPYRRYLPGHGGPIADGPAQASALLRHRAARNLQIVAAVAAGATTLRALLTRIYPNLAPKVRPAALMTLRAHLEYLADRGDLTLHHGPLGPRIAPARQ